MSGKLKKILICGNYGIGNLGDEAILDGLIRIIKSAHLNSKITVFSSNAVSTKKHFGGDAINYFPAGFRSFFKFWLSGDFFKTISAVLSADLVIIGGGGLFSDEKKRAVWIWFVQSLWFFILRKKIVCLGQSVGPLNTSIGRKLSSLVFKNAKFVSVRDPESKILLESLGVKNVQVYADPAYAIGYDAPSFLNRNNVAILSMRTWIKDNSSSNREIAKLIEWLDKEYGLKTIFLPFQINEDKARYLEIRKLLKNQDILEFAEVNDDYKKAIDLIAKAKVVIGMRLHSIIFSVITKTPFLALSYSSKVKNFVKTLGLDNFLEYQNFNFEQLKFRIKHILAEPNSLSRELEKQKLHFTYEAFKHEKILKDLLK